MFNPEEFFNALGDSEKEQCWMSIGQFGEGADNPSIFVVDISEDDLKELDFEEVELKGSAELTKMDSLQGVISQKEIDMHKLDFKDLSSYVVVLYCDDKYVTSAQGD